MIRLFLTIITISTIYNLKIFSQRRELSEIIFELPSFSDKYAKIAYYYGKKIFLKDSVRLDQSGQGVYKEECHEGLYILLLPDSTIFEFIITDRMHYRIFNLTKQGIGSVCITGNPATEAYTEYLFQKKTIQDKADSLEKILNNASDTSQKNALRNKIRELQNCFDSLTNAVIRCNEGNLSGNYLKSQLPVRMPVTDFIDLPVRNDSLLWMAQLVYFRKHYFDNMVWDDARLIYTPVLEDKIETYLDKLTLQNPSALSDAIDRIIAKQVNDKVNQFVISYLLNKFERSKNTGLGEYVYIYLLENYYLNGKSPWISKEDSAILRKETEKIRPVTLLKQAPEISLPDKDEVVQSLYKIDSDYTLVFFWDYSCTACKRILADLVHVANKYSYLGLQVYTVYTGNDPDVWRAFLAKKIPSGWINTIQTGPVNYSEIYNISRTPTLYLLDKNKIILDKYLTVPEIDSYLFNSPKKDRQ